MVRRAPAESDLPSDPAERAAVAAAQRDPARFDALYEVKHIYGKLAVRSRAEAVYEALQLGIVK